MTAYVYVSNFGSDEQKRKLCKDIHRVSMEQAYINDMGVVVVPCRVQDLGNLFIYLSEDAETNWVEYTVQFQA